jgi:uncharacterized protein (DUF849 family)
MDPAVIAVAPTGARRTKADHPALPLTPPAIAHDAAACAEVGASVLHLHVRDAAGAHTLDATTYRAAMNAVRDAAGDNLLVQVTTEAVGRYTPGEQMSLVRDLRPEAISIAMRELIPDDAAESTAAEFLTWTMDAGIGVQYILYAGEEAARFVGLVRRGIVPQTQPHALFVLGGYTTGKPGTPALLLPFLEQWPTGWPWTVCAWGAEEARCLSEAIRLGGHVRVGFENNVLRPDGEPARDNAEQVARMRDVVGGAGRRVATSAEARQVYGLHFPRP